MIEIAPSTAQDLSQVLHQAASHSQRMRVIGHDSKRMMSGPVAPADIALSTAKLTRILQYEPNDLTISVEAGMPLAQVQALLANHNQMIALDPPFLSQATVGGVIASNSSGPMRRGFGTARDLVIGMTFATLDGKLISTGGMVVKNVAGLDIGKLMIGSFGTLGVITSVNFRLHARPPETRTFLFSLPDLQTAIKKRDSILASVLQPFAIDLISPAAAIRLGFRDFLLAVRASGSSAVLQRYSRDLSGSAELTEGQDADFWGQVREFAPEFLARQPEGVVLRVSTTLADIPALLRLISGPAISRAGSGITYVYLSSWRSVPPLWTAAVQGGWIIAVEFSPDDGRNANELLLLPSMGGTTNCFAMMKKVKQMFDPQSLLNRGRLYGRI
ncbi:MAG: FAD-binding oxidoreductase [Acidobacteriaceae bacterium]|nr:FAD-binding oxidoreductase [Acidobacteriaceae bacterium]MBV9781981.1 FAD-binding oxidoreductase [Acidobacteriaceae bacterium]